MPAGRAEADPRFAFVSPIVPQEGGTGTRETVNGRRGGPRPLRADWLAAAREGALRPPPAWRAESPVWRRHPSAVAPGVRARGRAGAHPVTADSRAGLPTTTGTSTGR